MSYVLDAGRFGHTLDALAPRYFDHMAMDYNDVIGTGKAKVTFDCVEFEKAAPYVAEDADVALRLAQRAARADGRRARDHRLRDAGASAGAGAGAHGAARHFGRPAGAVAALGRIRAARRGAGRRSPQARRRSGVQSGQPEAARRHPVRQDAAARRHQDQDRAVVDRRARARRARRAGRRAGAEDPGVAADHQAEVDLHRRAARLHQPARPSACTRTTRSPRPRPGACRPPSRTCRTSRSAPRRAARSAAPSWRRRATSSSRPTIRRSSCGCSPRSPTCRRCARRSRTAPTFTR